MFGNFISILSLGSLTHLNHFKLIIQKQKKKYNLIKVEFSVKNQTGFLCCYVSKYYNDKVEKAA